MHKTIINPFVPSFPLRQALAISASKFQKARQDEALKIK